MKLIKSLEKCKNEIMITEKIKEIPFFFLYFNTIKNYKLVKVNEIDEYFIENDDKMDINIEKLDKKSYILLTKEKLHYPCFLSFFQNISSLKERITHLLYSYKYLLKSLIQLNLNNIVYFNINSEKIGFNKKKQPILNNFDQSFLNKNKFLNFNVDPAELFSLPIELHIICFLQNNAISISQTNIEEICKNFIDSNPILSRLAEKTKEEFYVKTITQCFTFAIVNQPREKIIEKMMRYSGTWDNYSLSILFLPYILQIREVSSEFSRLLFSNIDPNPEKRMTGQETLNMFDEIF